jgi:4-amino-4-deoxy-L-arabinose transferase-like glycosyltransferase/tetratricopeptide (TPR) repeat protein
MGIKRVVVEHRALLAIVALALLIRLWHVNWGLPAVYEEAMPMNVAWQMWNWDGDGIDLHPRVEHKEHFFIYPALTFYLNFLLQAIQFLVGRFTGAYENLAAFRAAFETDPTAFALIARFVTIGFDVGTIIVAYRIGVRFFPGAAGSVAALLIVLNPLHVRQAHLINVDTPLTFFVVLSTFFFLKILTDSTRSSYVWAGLAAGAATATKYNGALLFAVLAGVHMLRSRSLGTALAWLRDSKLVLALGSGLGVFLALNPFILLSFGAFVQEFGQVQRHMELGHLTADPNQGAFAYYVFSALPSAMGWGMFLLSLLGAIVLAIRKNKRGLVLLGFPLAYGVTLSTWAVNADRYALPMVPLLVLLGVLGFLWIVELLCTHLTRLNFGAYRISAVLVGTLLLAFPSAGAVLAYQRTHTLTDTRTLTLDWIRTNVKPRSVIASGPFMIRIPEDVYLTLPMPFNAGASEQTFAFYNTAWYEDADIVVTSDYDYARYAADPGRFRSILPFYDSLKTRWRKVFEIAPQEDQAGYTFRLYAPPPGTTADAFDPTAVGRLKMSPAGYSVPFMGKLGLILSSRQKNIKAAQLFGAVLDLEPANQPAQRALALCYFQAGDYERALSLSEEYLNVHPADPELLGASGSALLDLGRVEEAREHLSAAVERGSRAPMDYVNLALIHISDGELQKAHGVLTLALRILPANGPNATLMRQTLASIEAAMKGPPERRGQTRRLR